MRNNEKHESGICCLEYLDEKKVTAVGVRCELSARRVVIRTRMRADTVTSLCHCMARDDIVARERRREESGEKLSIIERSVYNMRFRRTLAL